MRRAIVIAAVAGLLVGVPVGFALEPRLTRCEDQVLNGPNDQELSQHLADGWNIVFSRYESTGSQQIARGMPIQRFGQTVYTLRKCTWP